METATETTTIKFITKDVLAALLKCSQKDAHKKILRCMAEMGKINENPTERDLGIYPDPGIKPEELKNYLGIDFDFYLRNIREKYLTTQGTKRYILEEYPEGKIQKILKKIENSEYVKPQPSKIRIPSVLRKLLTPDQHKEILTSWNNRYSNLVSDGIVEFKI